MPESLLTPSSVLIFGRVLADLQIVAGASGGGGGFLSAKLAAADAKLAGIYGFSFEGEYVDLMPPAIFLVQGNGGNTGTTVEGSGLALTDEAFSTDIKVWPYDKSDFTMRLDPSSGTFEDILLAVELGGDMDGFAGAHARGAHARGAHARGAHARGAHARGAHARGAHARGAHARGSSD